MSNQEFDLDRRRELQSALSNLTTALWEVEAPAPGDPGGPIGLDKPVLKLLKAAGYPADVTRLVSTLLTRATDEAGDQHVRVRDVQALIESAEDGPGTPATVQRALRAAGVPADVSRRVVAALEPPAEDDTDPETAVKRAARAAGYPADAVRRVVAALEPPAVAEEDPQTVVRRAVKAAGYPAEVSRRVLAALEPPSEEEDPQTVVRRAVKAAGYPIEVSRRVVAALETPTDDEDPQAAVRRILLSAGYPADAVQLVRSLLAAPDGGDEARAVVPRVLKKAGYAPEVSRLVQTILDRYGAADHADERLPLRDLSSLLDASGDPTRIKEPVRRVLLGAGYPSDIVGLVGAVLERFGERGSDGRGLAAADLQPLLAPIEDGVDLEPLRRLLRVAGYRADLINLVFALLDRYGDPDLVDSGLRVSDLQLLVEPAEDGPDPREPVRRILRVAGYRTDLVNLVGALLDRYGTPEEPTDGARVRDLAELVTAADDDLLSMVRHWGTTEPDARRLGRELVALMGHGGIDLDAARDLAAAVTNPAPGVQLPELARVARFALTAEDASASMAEPAWLEEPTFAAAYAEAKAISAWGRDIKWRVQTLVKLAAGARHLEGDFVECGVDTGGTARAIMAYLGDEAFEGRTFYLFDTFRGLVPEQLLPDEPAPIEDRYPDVAAVARANFADKSYARIVEGVVPETLSQYAGAQVAFLHIDMNAAYPEVEAFRHFWHSLVPGAPVVFDDYGFPRHRAQRRAIDEVAASLDVEIMMLPTCQGIVFKPPTGV